MMIAIIPAAGLGTRFLPFTKSVPKELVPIINTPAIQCVIEEAIFNDIHTFCIISSKEKTALKEYFTENRLLDTFLAQKGKLPLLNSIHTIIKNNIFTFVEQNAPLGLGHAVLCAKETVNTGTDYVTIMLPDELLFANPATPALLLQKMLTLAKEHNASVIAVKQVAKEETGSYGIIQGTPLKDTPGCFLVNSVIEKPKPTEAPSCLAVIGRYVLDTAIFDLLPQVKPGSGGEIQLTDGISALIQSGKKVIACQYTQHRFDVGNPVGWLAANTFKNTQTE